MKVSGLDVHKDSIFCAIYDGKLYSEVKEYDSTTNSVRNLGLFLQCEGVKQVAMESTSIYWTPVCGWLVYYRYAQCKRQLRNLDAWIRRKLRCYRIKQCKRVITLQRFLESCGVAKWHSWIIALSGKGNWRKSGSPQAAQAMGNKWFDEEVGLYNLSLNYVRLNRL
jgi:hypothetical protein